MTSDTPVSRARFTRRQALIAGASGVLAFGSMLAAPPAPANAAVSPKLPGEVGRQNNWTSRFGGTPFDHIRVRINGDDARLFVPQGIVPGQQDVGVLWLYHGAGSTHDALIGGFKQMGERAVDLGLIAICQNLGGTLYTHPKAVQAQIDGAAWMSSVYGVGRSFLRGTSHGGAMAVEALVRDLVPNVVGSYVVNGAIDIEHQYYYGSAHAQSHLRGIFGDDIEALRAANPMRHTGAAWSGKRIRVIYSEPDSSDTTTPPQFHAKPLLANATPMALEASFRTHASGHNTPSFGDLENSDTITRWTAEFGQQPEEPETPSFPEPVARWDFAESAAPFASSVAGAASLVQGAGSKAAKVTTPFGGGIQLNGRTDYLRVPAASVGPLNVGAGTGKVTVAAWVYSTDTNNALIAGCWREGANGARSYALFNDLPTYGGDDRVCMNVSKTGGATAGYAHSIDHAADPRSITRGSWQFHVGTYDGAQAVAYLDGTAESFPSYTDSKKATYAKNPYLYADGLNAAATDFLVGAGNRDGALNNLHQGTIARLRVWDSALTAEQIASLYAEEKALLAPVTPPAAPGPIASWDFAESAAPYASSVAGVAALQQGKGSASTRVTTPFGGGVTFDGTKDFLLVPTAEVGKLNVGASTGKVTVAAWVLSTDTDNAIIAGCWQESRSDPRRSYALFNDLPMYGGDDMVCMEVSKGGGATPGYPFSIDYASEPRKITRKVWQFYTGTYDGVQAIAYLDGAATSYPTFTDNQGATYAKNPFTYPDGLNATPVDFTVAAVVRDGTLINRHKGSIAKLRVWDRALSATEIKAIYDAERPALG